MEHIWNITAKIGEGFASALGRSPHAHSKARIQDPGRTVATDLPGNAAQSPKDCLYKDGYGRKDQSAAPALHTVDSVKQCSSQLGRDGQPCKRQRMEEHSTQGVRHRRVDAGAICSHAMPHTGARPSFSDKHDARPKSFLFPERIDKSAQVTPSLRDTAWAKTKTGKATNRAQNIKQQPLPPADSQHDCAQFSISKSIVPKRWPRGSRRITTDLVHRMQNTRISGQSIRVDDNEVEVLKHTGPSPGSAEWPMEQAWHQHTDRYQELDKQWAQEEKRIEAQDAYNRKLASAHAQVRASKMRSDESMLKAEVDTSELSFADRMVQQAQAHRLAMCAKSPYLAKRMQLEQSILRTSATLRSEPPSAEKIDLQDDDEVVILTDSEGEQPEKPVPAQDDGGAVNLLSDSDESVASESEAEDEEESAFPNAEALFLDIPERVISGHLCAAYEQLVMKLRQYDTVVSHDRAHVGITGEEFHTMAPKAWLGDACINMYIALLQDRDKEWYFSGSEQKRPRCLFMNSHFVTKLCQEPGGYDYSKVSRWTAARKRKALAIEYYGGIEDLDKLVLPVHLGNHWTCAVLNFEEQRIEYYDSLRGVDSTTINSLLRWVEDEYADKYSKTLPERFQTKNWTKLFNPEGTPQQLNGHDCGVFAMMCCNYVSADREFDYSQDEVHSFFRKMCCLECYCKRLRSIDL